MLKRRSRNTWGIIPLASPTYPCCTMSASPLSPRAGCSPVRFRLPYHVCPSPSFFIKSNSGRCTVWTEENRPPQKICVGCRPTLRFKSIVLSVTLLTKTVPHSPPFRCVSAPPPLLHLPSSALGHNWISRVFCFPPNLVLIFPAC